MLYTIMPMEIVFGEINGNHRETMDMDYMGVKVQVYKNYRNEYVISRVLSTSPKAYLNPNLQPGSLIKKGV